MDTILDFSNLAAAVKNFESMLAVYDRRLKEQAPDDEQSTLRAGVIQGFEFVYELSWKAMKRWIETNLNADMDSVPRREIFRLGVESSLIDNKDMWMEFHLARNRTSHTYDDDTAEDVLATARRFLPYAQGCLKRLEERV